MKSTPNTGASGGASDVVGDGRITERLGKVIHHAQSIEVCGNMRSGGATVTACTGAHQPSRRNGAKIHGRGPTMSKAIPRVLHRAGRNGAEEKRQQEVLPVELGGTKAEIHGGEADDTGYDAPSATGLAD